METLRITRIANRAWFQKLTLLFVSAVVFTLAVKLARIAVQKLAEVSPPADPDDADRDEWVGEEFKDQFEVCLEPGNLKALGHNHDPLLIVITPTYERAEQVAELTNLAQTLTLVPSNLLWIIVEDSHSCHDLIQNVVQRKFGQGERSRSGDNHRQPTHRLAILTAPMPTRFRAAQRMRRWGLPRGVAGRRAALAWLLAETGPNERGVIYFADDDNTYDTDLFVEILKTRRLSMFPVGLLEPTGARGPIVNELGRVIGFMGERRPFRMFPVDMAGFAFSLALLHDKRPKMPFRATHEEEGFLRSLEIQYSEIEPLADNGTRILVWHTRTASPTTRSYRQLRIQGKLRPRSNLPTLAEAMFKQGLVAQGSSFSVPDIPVCIGAQCYTK